MTALAPPTRRPTKPSEPEFRRAMAQFASGVTVVTTRDAQGTPLGLTRTTEWRLSRGQGEAREV